jgi:hypothetical protein
MLAEAPVLVGLQHLDKARIDVAHRRRQTPAAVRRRIGPQQRPLRSSTCVESSTSRTRGTGPSVRTHHAPPATAANRGARQGVMRARISSHHFGAISMVPVPVRPKRSGRYMSST